MLWDFLTDDRNDNDLLYDIACVSYDIEKCRKIQLFEDFLKEKEPYQGIL